MTQRNQAISLRFVLRVDFSWIGSHAYHVCKVLLFNFISAAAMELMVAPLFVSREQMDFMMMLLFILLIGSTQYEPKLHSVKRRKSTFH